MAGARLETQVVVVGAGPVGLLLAGELRLGGAEVVVLERRTGPTTESRASTLHARTAEILDSRGLLDELGDPPRQPVGHWAGIPLDLTLPGPHAGQWKVPQYDTERLLERWARSLGADVRRGHHVHGVTQDTGPYVETVAEGPGGALRVRADHVVACDGEDSTVRRLLGAAFPGHAARRELVRADIAGVEVPDRRFQRLPDGFAVAARRPDGVTRVMAHAFGTSPQHASSAPEFTDVAEVWKRVTGEDISAGTPLWVNAFDDTNRQLDQYRHGRVLFAGDAAHRQLPIGGQALNLGLADAFNLGWKLAAHVTGRAHPGLLDSYHGERHPVGRRVLAGIRAQALLLLGGPEVEPVRALTAELIALEPVRAHLAGLVTGLDVRHDVGGPAHPLLGALLPHLALDTPGGPTSTTALLRAGRGLRIAPHDGTGPGSDGPVLVRPDGHVVAAGPEHDAQEQTARARWFPAGATVPTT
ncbi:FAD-dependent monooxygenase [Streptomyces sp. NPDC008150]|uniref:FAD-dependent monooxygenase n=1 Tax=Streptomyces sp. NPDC008150 TaxID=3364816 RepID=UPI0036E0ED50